MTEDDLVATMFVNGERKVIAIQSAGYTGRMVDKVWLDELADLQDIPPHKRPEEIPAPWSPNNRKARRAQAAERRRRR